MSETTDGGRQVIVAHMTAVAEAAKHAIAGADANLATAVHEVRKALRRARAIVDLLDRELPRRERRGVRAALREARRELGPARDHGVAPRVLAQLELADGERAAVSALIASAAPAEPDVRAALAHAGAVVTEQIAALQSALPEVVDMTALVHGARAVYKDARRARKGATKRRAFHAWRRRTKELGYQLDVLASLPGAAAIGEELEKTSASQGEVVDLIMMRDLVRSHRDRLEGDTAARVVDALDARLATMMEESRRAGRDAFKAKAGQFGKRLVANGAA